MRKKAILPLMLSAAMMMGLAACGSAETSESSEANTTAQER